MPDKKLRVVAVIPARGGSKGIPRKNINLLGGKPLIQWTIDAALSSMAIDRVVVSTDDEEIAAIAKKAGAEVPFLRPAEFSGDLAPAIGVIRHALERLLATGDPEVDVVAYLQPTSPFRNAAQIDEAILRFTRYRPDTLVSMTPIPHNMVPQSAMRVCPGEPGYLELAAGQQLRRQDKEAWYARNGPAILLVSASFVTQCESFYTGSLLGYEMDRLTSLDIDTSEDLEMAHCLLPLLQLRADRHAL